MFMISMLIYTLIAGQPIDAPTVFTHKAAFADLDKCQAYLTSAQFQIDKMIAIRLLASSMPVADGAEIPELAATASCVPDTRI